MSDLPSPTIHRYVLGIMDQQVVRMPAGARPVHVEAAFRGAGTSAPCIEMWARVDLDQPMVNHRFVVCGTGHVAPPEDEWDHVGTVIHQLPNGRSVWHVYAEARPASAPSGTQPGEGESAESVDAYDDPELTAQVDAHCAESDRLNEAAPKYPVTVSEIWAGILVGLGGEHDTVPTREQIDRATRLIVNRGKARLAASSPESRTEGGQP